MQFRYFELSFRHFEKISKFRNFDKNSFLLLLKSCQNAGTAFCYETDDKQLFRANNHLYVEQSQVVSHKHTCSKRTKLNVHVKQ